MAEHVQKWWCERCSKEGQVTFEDGEGVYEVLYRIGDDHDRLAPTCAGTWGCGYVRVENTFMDAHMPARRSG